MAYSGDPTTSLIDAVRHIIGDTDPAEPILADAEIAYDLGRAGDDVPAAAIACVRALMTRYAALADTADGELSVKASQLFDHYKDLLAALTDPGGGGLSLGAVPYAGGVSVADVGMRQADRDRVPGTFERPVLRHPRAWRWWP